MLSVDFIRQNKEKVIDAARSKGAEVQYIVEEALKLDEERRHYIQEIQKLREEHNADSKTKPTPEIIEKAKKRKDQIQHLENSLKNVEEALKEKVYAIPNLPADGVPTGKDESENVEEKKWGEIRDFDFEPKDHIELGETLDLIDVKRASTVSGSRFAYLKNQLVQLEFALVNLAMMQLIQAGFTPIIPPALIKKEITEGLGYWTTSDHTEYYWVNEDEIEGGGYYLIGTAEHSVVAMHKNEIFDKKDLPHRYVAFSSCFRREAGSYGKDVRGILRVHQFDKVEMVSFTTPDKDEEENEFLLAQEEALFQKLEIPYRVLKMCTGDLGFPAARKYDIEAWVPSQKAYREVTSTSTTTDFQARRLNIKYRDGNKTDFVHILNGTAFAIGRTLITILENYQQKNGSISIPKVLQPLVGFDTIKA